MVPWTFLAPFFVRKNPDPLEASFKRFLSCWVIVFFVFFSVSRAKANYYMMVGIPPMALWLGAYLAEWPRRRLFLTIGLCFSGLLMVAGIFYLKQNEDQFSVRPSVQILNKEEPVYLYKRFEELSTVPFYVGRVIPILESESRDLWYGQQVSKKDTIFLDFKSSLKKLGAVYVMKRDQESFLEKHRDIPKKIIYDSRIYSIFYFIEKFRRESVNM
jgi:hypothetical protein